MLASQMDLITSMSGLWHQSAGACMAAAEDDPIELQSGMAEC